MEESKYVFCTKCKSYCTDKGEILLMESGELDNRCPCCGEIGSLVLLEDN